MCAIAGILSPRQPVRTDDIHPLIASQSHRGPDGAGEWSDGFCVLGHRRLAIIDLTAAGKQPMCNEDGSLWITFNGEIYNFAALRSHLIQLGHSFHSETDTEVILHAFEQWGNDCVKRLRGMFAFAIWDQNTQKLFVARDRIGKKPLYYSKGDGHFVFASELQGVLADPRIVREVDWQAIDAYLAWGYVPAPLTAFRDVCKLPPAHWLTVEVIDGKLLLNVQRYWSLRYSPKLLISENEACEALHEKMLESVRLRMVSDVPVGAFLSGGVDSSIVVGLMASVSDRPIKTFSIGFSSARWNELTHARRVADLWSTDHHEFIVEPDALAVVPKLVRHYGEPFADSSAIPSYYVSLHTRESVTVALNGDGGDESFAGYERYLGIRMAERLQGIVGARGLASSTARILARSRDRKSRVWKAKRFLEAVGETRSGLYRQWMRYFGGADKLKLYSRELQGIVDHCNPEKWIEGLFDDAGCLDSVDASMAVDVQSYLPYDLLVKMDIASMACGLEARSPFLDHEVMEFAAQLPSRAKLNGRTSKYLLRRAFAEMLPAENVERVKMGFSVPVDEWMRGPLRSFVWDTLLSNRSLSCSSFVSQEVKRLISEHVEGRENHGHRLWALLMLELWHHEFVNSPPAVSRAS